MKNRMKKVVCSLLVASLALAMVGCSSSSDDAAADTSADAAAEEEGGEEAASDSETIRFALMSPMTGDAAATGAQQDNGVKLAVEAINAAGGVNGKMLEYDVFDDQANTNQAVICGEKIAADGNYRFVVASNSSGCSQAAYPALEAAGIPLVSGVNTADFMTNQGFTMYMRICVKDSAQTEQLVAAAVEAGYTKPAIFYTTAETDTTNFQLATQFLKDNYDIDVVESAQIQPETEKDFAAHITNFRSAGADCVFFFSEYSPAALFIKQAASLGWEDYGRYSSAGCSNPQLIEIAGADVAEGFISVSSFVADKEHAEGEKLDFINNYVELADVDPGEWAAGAYDVVCMMADVLSNEEAADLTGQELVDWIKENETYEGIMVDVDIDENGDNTAATIVQQVVSDGVWRQAQ